jgi:hypothetical protein
MIKIAHRGNQNGPVENENEPTQLVATLSGGFDVEVDVWLTPEGLFLGHDGPQYLVDDQFLKDIGDSAWYHCKNIEALEHFNKNLPDLRYFWHQKDDYTLTSNGYIWTYPGQKVTERSILVHLDKPDLSTFDVMPYAICSDYVREF